MLSAGEDEYSTVVSTIKCVYSKGWNELVSKQ